MNLFKKNKKIEEIYDIDNIIDESRAEEKNEEAEVEFDPNSLDNVLSRVEAGLIGSLRIDDKMNYPIIKKNDIVHLRTPQRVLRKDFILYVNHNEYYLRRIIKYKDEGIWVAGDNESSYHVIDKKDIIAKAVGRERKGKYLSLTLHQVNPLYTFFKVKLAYLRLGNRVSEYEAEVNNEALEAAMQNLQTREELEEYKLDYVSSEIIETDLSGFKNPNDLAREYIKEHQEEETNNDSEPDSNEEPENEASNETLNNHNEEVSDPSIDENHLDTSESDRKEIELK